MIDGMFVFDCVIHAPDLSEANLRNDKQSSRKQSLAFQKWMVDTLVGQPYTEMLHRLHGPRVREVVEPLPADIVFDACFRLSPLDMAMAQTVPVFDHLKGGFAPLDLQHELAQMYPERVMLCGGVDPGHQGVKGAQQEMERQVKELGAVSIKFYNGHIDHSWRCDDRELAYPMYEKALELGVDVVQFHKGFPIGHSPYTAMSPLDIERAAHDFPEMRFVIHHLAVPMWQECLYIALRFENVYLALSGVMNTAAFAPRVAQEMLGALLQMLGPDRLMWGSEAMLNGYPGPNLRAFADLEMPEDLRKGYGYPDITREDREKILGLNFAKLMKVDVEAKKKELAAAPVYDEKRAAEAYNLLAELMAE